jgi:hypothetical protein
MGWPGLSLLRRRKNFFAVMAHPELNYCGPAAEILKLGGAWFTSNQ